MLPDFDAESGDCFSTLVSFPVPLLSVGNDAPPSGKQQVIFSFLFLFNLNAGKHYYCRIVWGLQFVSIYV